MTLLHLAAEEDTVKIIKFFLNSLKGHEKILKSLVEATTNYYHKNYYYMNLTTALHLAAAGGYLDVVQCLVEHGADVNVKSNPYQSAFHWDSKWGVVTEKLKRINEMFVKHGKANVEAKDKYGQTVLHSAAQGNLDVVQWLVKHEKANVEATDNDGRNVMHWASCGKTALHWAVCGNLYVVKWLVEHGKADVEVKDDDGQTVLHLAAQGNKWDVVQWLVKYGKANVEAKDHWGRTVLYWAAQSNLNVFQWLVKHGADVNTKDVDDPLGLLSRFRR
uniref:Uncharacterized protein n=1 Tax=Acrobeloides nanus TaxID=290746 RepID=A0A914ENI6_9BILA